MSTSFPFSTANNELPQAQHLLEIARQEAHVRMFFAEEWMLINLPADGGSLPNFLALAEADPELAEQLLRSLTLVYQAAGNVQSLQEEINVAESSASLN